MNKSIYIPLAASLTLAAILGGIMGTLILQDLPSITPSYRPIQFGIGLTMLTCMTLAIAALACLAFRYLFIDPKHRHKHENIKTAVITILFLANCWGLSMPTTGHVSSDIYLGLTTPTHIGQLVINAVESL